MLPIIILMIFSLGLLSSSYASSDFCVADLEGPQTPFGYTCKKVSNVTVDDFVFSKLGEPTNFSAIDTFMIRAMYVQQFPGLNGLGLTAARLELAVGAVMPLHNRRGASQILFVTEGTMGCGFIASDNTVYYKTLKKGDAMIVPQGLLQFQVNEGDTRAAALISFSSTNPGFQVTGWALFNNVLPTSLLQKISFIDEAEIEKIKKMFANLTG